MDLIDVAQEVTQYYFIWSRRGNGRMMFTVRTDVEKCANSFTEPMPLVWYLVKLRKTQLKASGYSLNFIRSALFNAYKLYKWYAIYYYQERRAKL